MKKIVRRCLILTSLVLVCISISSSAVFAINEKTTVNNNDLIYFIFTDRFNDGDTSNNKDVNKDDLKSFEGGDWQGIIDKLDYIKDLGFTTIWISPVVKNDTGGYHGYWAVDFYKTEDHFGTIDKLKELVNKSHEKGMKVVVDLVVNHAGMNHPFVSDPKYKDWFHDTGSITNYDDQNEVENGKLAGLPDFNTENPEVKKYLIDMAKWWIKEVKFDGYRLDTVKHVPKEFWTDFISAIKKDYPNFYFIGEVWNGDPNYVAPYQQTGIDGFVDFPMYYAMLDVFAGNNAKGAVRLSSMIEDLQSRYKKPDLMGTFIDNHDVDRFLSKATSMPDERMKQALAFEMTYTGIPILYYGTEVGLDGSSDPLNRKFMDWSKKGKFYDYIKQLTSIRKTNAALTQGDIKIIKQEKDYLLYARKSGDNVVFSAFNVSKDSKTAEVPIYKEYRKQNGRFKYYVLTDLISSKDYKITDDKVTIDMSPRGASILTFKEIDESFKYYTIFALGFVVVVFIITLFIRRRMKKGNA